MSQSNWDKGFTAGAKAGRKGETNSVCTICCDGCKEHGERVEQKRIIKLLEEHAEQEFADNYARDDGTYHEDVCNLCAKWNGLGVAIALIKGEK